MGGGHLPDWFSPSPWTPPQARRTVPVGSASCPHCCGSILTPYGGLAAAQVEETQHPSVSSHAG